MIPAAQPTLVVKMSDTSLPWVKRVRLPPLMSRTVEVPRQGLPRATAQVASERSTCVDSLKTDIAVPQRTHLIAGVLQSSPAGGGEDVCYFG